MDLFRRQEVNFSTLVSMGWAATNEKYTVNKTTCLLYVWFLSILYTCMCMCSFKNKFWILNSYNSYSRLINMEMVFSFPIEFTFTTWIVDKFLIIYFIHMLKYEYSKRERELPVSSYSNRYLSLALILFS